MLAEGLLSQIKENLIWFLNLECYQSDSNCRGVAGYSHTCNYKLQIITHRHRVDFSPTDGTNETLWLVQAVAISGRRSQTKSEPVIWSPLNVRARSGWFKTTEEALHDLLLRTEKMIGDFVAGSEISGGTAALGLAELKTVAEAERAQEMLVGEKGKNHSGALPQDVPKLDDESNDHAHGIHTPKEMLSIHLIASQETLKVETTNDSIEERVEQPSLTNDGKFMTIRMPAPITKDEVLELVREMVQNDVGGIVKKEVKTEVRELLGRAIGGG